MCLLIAAPNGLKNLTQEMCANAYDANPHGMGIAWRDTQGRVWYDKGMDFDALVRRIAQCAELPSIVHFRYATHGAECVSNCHPFPHGDYVAAHNGIIDIMPSLGMTDTETYLKTLPQKFAELDFDAIAQRIGDRNKMAFLSADDLKIVHEGSGSWEGGMWFSNDSHRFAPYRYSPLGGNSWTDPWDDGGVWLDTADIARLTDDMRKHFPARLQSYWEGKLS